MKKIFSLVLGRAKLAVFNIWVALNMLLCAVLFNVFALPRETLSGFIGRQTLTCAVKPIRFAFYYMALLVDFFYPNEPAHCGETMIAEDQMRWELYPQHVIQAPPVDNNESPVVSSDSN